MASQIGSPIALMGIWILAGVVSLLGTLSNAELASMMPRTGGQYSWFFYIANAWAVITLRRREPESPRPYKVPGYPFVPLIFVGFGLVYLVLTLINDVTAYRNAVAAGQPALLNCALGLALVLSGAPVFLYYRNRTV